MISVVVCTYNRSDLLPGCLKSLVEQTAGKAAYEVIVVNNNSTDATQEVAESFAAHESNFRVVVETAQGLSHARNRGWKESRGEYVAYIDDDARAEREWLANALRVIAEQAPDIFGGPIYPFYLTEKPKWFSDAYEIRRITTEPLVLSEKEHISGSNCFAKRRLLEMLGGFRVDLGMTGKTLAYGEEIELTNRARQALEKCHVFYDPAVRVLHLVPERKMRVGSIARARWAAGLTHARIDKISHGSRAMTILRLTYVMTSIGYALVVGMLMRDRTAHPYWQNYFVDRVAGKFWSLAYYLTKLRILRWDEKAGPPPSRSHRITELHR